MSKKTLKIFSKNTNVIIIIIIMMLAFYIFKTDKSQTQEIRDNFPEINYPHYTKLPITYQLKNMERCLPGEKERMEEAFRTIQEATNNIVRFQESTDPDIYVDCIDLGEQIKQFSLNKQCEEIKIKNTASTISWQEYRANISSYKSELLKKGMYLYPDHTQLISSDFITKICYLNSSSFEYSPEYIFSLLPKTNTDGLLIYRETTEGISKPKIIDSVIEKSTLEIYRNTPKCDNFPSVEIHEILHSLGFDHYAVPGDIMNPEFTNCNDRASMDKKYAECLKYIYSNAVEGQCNYVNFL